MRQCGVAINPYASWFPGWFSGDRQEPWSGDVSQLFRILSPTVTVNGRGEPGLEAQIVQDVATYGAQLGPITDLLLALATDQEPPAEALAKLQQISQDVREKKEAFRKGAGDRARKALADLREHDPGALAELLAEFREPPARPT